MAAGRQIHFFILLFLTVLFSKATNAPACFIENKGQLSNENNQPVDEVLYYMSTPSGNIYITTKGLSIVQFQSAGENKKGLNWARTDISFLNGSIHPNNIVVEEKTEQHYNFFFPHCKEGIYNVNGYNKITIKNIYPGIDWDLTPNPSPGGEGSASPLKYDFIVHPGANINNIKFLIEGSDVRLQTNQYTLTNPLGSITEGKLECFQNKKLIPSNYESEITEQGTVLSFNIGDYDHKKKLIIDPPLTWSTYLGGNGSEGFNGVTTDAAGNVYTIGQTASSVFPTQTQTGSYNTGTLAGSTDVIFSKFDNNGKMLWCSYYGSPGDEWGYSCCVDPSNNLYLTGMCESNSFPLKNLAGAFNRTTFAAAKEAFLLKFDGAGILQWSTFYGGAGEDWGKSVCSDATGNIYLMGDSPAIDIPVTNPGGAFTKTAAGVEDVFIAKFNTAGVLVWSTYFGGNKGDYAGQIHTDKNGNILIIGTTASQSGFPLQDPGNGAFYQNINKSTSTNPQQVFLAKFNPSLQLIWSTYMGGTAMEKGVSVTTDDNGTIFATGHTNSNDFPVLPLTGSYNQGSYGGSEDSWLAKFTPSCKQLWTTFYGGSGTEDATYIVYDHKGTIYASGGEYASVFPIKNSGSGFNQSSNNGGWDSYLLSFDTAGVHLWGTYFGGNKNDFINSLATDAAGCLFATGYTMSDLLFPTVTVSGSYNQGTFVAGSYADGFVSKFCQNILSAAATAINPNCNSQNTGTATATGSNGTPTYTYSWSANANNQTTQTATGLGAGTYTVIITDNTLVTATATIIITEPTALNVNVTGTNASCGNPNGSAAASVSGGTSGYTYSWTGGATTISISNLAPNTYTLTVTDTKGCMQTQTVVISNSAGPSLSITTIDPLCNGSNTGTATVTAGGGTTPFTYSWSASGSSNSSSVSGLGAGTYTLTVTDKNNCTSSKTFSITANTTGLSVNAGTDTTITEGTTVQLQGNGNGTYTWSPAAGLSCTNCQSPVASPTTDTYYILTVTDNNGCTGKDTIYIKIEYNCIDLFIPTAFSPNGDGVNDVFKIRGNCIKKMSLTIFNRWGEKLFETNDLSVGWDGLYKGKGLDAAVFVYYLDVIFSTNKTLNQKGNVTLVR